MANQLNTTELDFNQIKENLKSYFKRSSSEFKDWDFDGSGLNNLLDVLAYNTHYNAMNSHMVMNESFLDSAQLRGNIVSRAKLLGYIPSSKTSSSASLTVLLTRKSTDTTTSSYTIKRGTIFTSKIGDSSYTFVVLSDKTASLSSDGANTFTFKDLLVNEGTIKNRKFVVDNSLTAQKFVIDDSNVDMNQLIIRVYNDRNSSINEVYNKFTEFQSSISGTSAIYFVEENTQGRYEISFGNNAFGKQPDNNSIVDIEFLSTSGVEANGARSFSWSGGEDSVVDGTSAIAVTSISSGGADVEDSESIRFNAPLSYISQNRAVTGDDYKALIKQNYPAIDSISVWGGEYNDPVDYGRVYISIKPTGALTLTEAAKNQILTMLESKRILSIQPKIVDPQYTNIFFNVFVKYNSNFTGETQTQIETNVRNVLSTFNDTNLQNFDGVFRMSNLLSTIDSSDTAILSSYARIYLYKDETFVLGSTSSKTIKFNLSLADANSDESIISSSSWVQNDQVLYFGDEETSSTSSERNIYVYKILEGVREKVVNTVGSLNRNTGVISISTSAVPLAQNETIRFEAAPASNDVVAEKSTLISIDTNKTTIRAEVDTLSVAGSSGASTYSTIERDTIGNTISSNTNTNISTGTSNTASDTSGNTGSSTSY